MSISYKLAENICFAINSMPGKGIKGIMIKGAEVLADKDELPRYLKQRDLCTKSQTFHGYTIHKLRAAWSKNASKKAVLFLPGGGGMARATALHYDTARRIALRTGADIFIVNYPLAPAHNVRFALDWLENLYKAVLKKYDPQNLTLMGDSAGANLILSLTQRIEKKPGKLIVISPACGLENGKNRNIRLAMEPHDPILSVKMNDVIAKYWCAGVELDSPDISPEHVDYAGFPPMLLFYGTHELFYPHVLNYVDMLRASGVHFQEESQPMCHDWALCSFFPEGRRAIKKMACYILK